MKTKFPYSLWYWTKGHENLFDLDRTALRVFKQFIKEATA